MNVSGFEFDEATHTYSRAGVVIPGVTRVIEWAGISDYSAVRGDVLERRSDEGRKAHEATHFYDEGDLEIDSLGTITRNYVLSWALWREHRKFVPAYLEHQTIAEINRMPFGMKLDRYGLVDGVPAIIEIKTTRMITDAHGIQTAFYAAGFDGGTEKHMPPYARFRVRRRIAVQLIENGGIAREREFSDLNDFEIAAAALAVSWWKLNRGKKIQKIED